MRSRYGLGLMLLFGNSAVAQYVVGARAGTLEFIVGNVYVDGQPAAVTEVKFPLLKEGQVLHTGVGRAEVLLGPAVFLRLGEQSAIRMVDSRLENAVIELQKGTAIVEVVDVQKGDRVEIQFGETHTEVRNIGLYRFEANPAMLRVFGGNAKISTAAKVIDAGRGKAVHLDKTLATSKFDPKNMDDLHKWAAYRSFDLFSHSPEAQERRTHWEETLTHWSWNRDFGMKLFSQAVATGYAQKANRAASAAAAQDRINKNLESLDQQRAQQAQADAAAQAAASAQAQAAAANQGTQAKK